MQFALLSAPRRSFMVRELDMEAPMQCPSLSTSSLKRPRPRITCPRFRWLGQNSKQNKLNRQLADVQIRMRLKASGDKSEIRQSYLPALFPHIVEPLIDEGAVRIISCCLFSGVDVST